MRNYLYYYSGMLKQRGIDILKTIQRGPIHILMPMYIHLKAVMIVSKEMMMEFINYSLNGVKVQYQHHKDSVVMFFSGKFNEKLLKEKIT